MIRTAIQVKKIDYHIGQAYHSLRKAALPPKGAQFALAYTACQLINTPEGHLVAVERAVVEFYVYDEKLYCFAQLKDDPDHTGFYAKGAFEGPILDGNPKELLLNALLSALTDGGVSFMEKHSEVPVYDPFEDAIRAVCQVMGTQDNVWIGRIENACLAGFSV